jgi:hypothetical protein
MNERAADALLRHVVTPTVGVALQRYGGTNLPEGDETRAGERLLQL